MPEVYGYANIVQADTTAVAWEPVVGEVHAALRCTFSNTNTFWIVGGDIAESMLRAQDPGASILSARLTDLPSFSEDAGIISGSPGLGTGAYGIADIDFAASDQLQARFANQQAVKGSLFTYYEAGPDDEFDDAHRVRTSRGLTYSDTEGRIDLTFEGVYSLLKGRVFAKETFNVATTVLPEDMFIPLAIDTATASAVRLPVFEHSQAYSTDPGATIGYFRTSTGEVVSYKSDRLELRNGLWGIPLFRRGLYDTIAALIEVDVGDARDAKPTIIEFVMLEERTVDLLAIVLEGQTTDGRVAPRNWTKALGAGLLNYASFASSAVGTEGRRFRHDDPDEMDVKAFVEERVLLETFGVLVENNYGQFQLLNRNVAYRDSVGQETLDETNLDLSYQMRIEHAVDQIRNPVIIKRGYDPIAKVFVGADITYDERTLRMYGDGVEEIVYQFYGWNSVLGSSRALEAATTRLRDLHQDQTVQTTVRALSHMGHIRLGQVIRLRLPPGLVRDASVIGFTKSQPIDHAFTVIARERDSESGNYTFALYATLGRAATQNETKLDHHLSREGYEALAPQKLSDFVPSTIVNGVRVFAAGVHEVPPDRFFRIDGPARTHPSCQLRPSKRGHYIGIAHYDSFVVATDIEGGFIDGRGMSVHQGTEDPGGNPGYIGAGTASGSIRLEERTTFNRTDAFSTPVPQKTRQPTVRTLRPWPLALDDGQLANLPRALGGSGGGGSGRVVLRRRNAADTGTIVVSQSGRAKGGDGGMSAVFLGPNLARTPGGTYADVSGGDPELAAGTVRGAVVGPGEPGSPGVVALIVDGDWPNPDTSFGAVVALTGDSTSSATRLARPFVPGKFLAFSPIVRCHFQANAQRDHSNAHTSIMHVPAPRRLGSRTLNAFDVLVEAERGFDGKITLHTLPEDTPPAFPSNADVNDYAAYLSDLRDQAIPFDRVRIFQLRNSGWEPVIFPDIIAEGRILQFRDRGTTVLWVTVERPAFGEYAVGDSWYDQQSRQLFYLGEDPDDDVLLSVDQFSDYTGLNFLADPTFAEAVIGGKDTLRFAYELNEQLSVLGEARAQPTSGTLPPGRTVDAYSVFRADNYKYRTRASDTEKRRVEWVESSNDGMLSQRISGGNGEGRVIYGSSEGVQQSDEFRQVWVYASGTGTVKVQGGGQDNTIGSPEKQSTANINIPPDELRWVKLNGQFPKFAGSIQLRASVENIRVNRILLLDKDSSSVPRGPGAFGGGGTATARVPGRPFWPVNNVPDKRYPLSTSSGNGPVQIGYFGVDGAPGVRISYPGSNSIIVMRERFPFKATAGKHYLLTALVRNELEGSLSDPSRNGVFIGLQCYDADRRQVLSTYSDAGGGGGLFGLGTNTAKQWLSREGTFFQELSAAVEIPDAANNIAWASLFLVVRGANAGFTRVDSWNAVEAERQILEHTVSSSTFSGMATQTGPRGTVSRNRVMRVWSDLKGKKGAEITASMIGEWRLDRHNGSTRLNDQYILSARVFVRYINAERRPIQFPIPGAPNARTAGPTLVLGKVSATATAGSQTTARIYNLQAEWTELNDSQVVNALHDFDRVTIQFFLATRGFDTRSTSDSTARNLLLRAFRVHFSYTGGFSDGHQEDES